MSLSPVEQEILLTLLLQGDRLPVFVAESFDRHPSSVSRSLANLKSQGLVAEVGRGVYTLTADGYAEARRLVHQRGGGR